MAQLSMNETTTYRWSFEEDVAACAAAGIPAIGVWRQKLSDCGQAKFPRESGGRPGGPASGGRHRRRLPHYL